MLILPIRPKYIAQTTPCHNASFNISFNVLSQTNPCIYVSRNIEQEEIESDPRQKSDDWVDTAELETSPASRVSSLTTSEQISAYYSGNIKKKEEKFQERVVQIRRVTKVVKGGKQLSFRAVVVIGDGKGRVGVGVGSAKEVIGAVGKAVTDAKRNITKVLL